MLFLFLISASCLRLEKEAFNDQTFQNRKFDYFSGPDSVTFTNCKFVDCTKGGKGYIIETNVADFSFIDSSITFSDIPTALRGGIYIEGSGYAEYLISGSYFTRTFSNGYAVGGLHFQRAKNNDNENDPQLNISNCVFNECYGTNSCCFFVNSTYVFTLENNTFQNCHSGSYLVVIEFTGTKQDEFTLVSQKFINNTGIERHGGGSGIWVIGSDKVIFEKCEWKFNTAKTNPSSIGTFSYGCGGAMQIGKSEKLKPIEVEYNGCIFDQNTAELKGGALYIDTTKPVHIIDCQFLNNHAGLESSFSGTKDGGAIVLETTVSFEVTGCTFKNNSANDSGGGIHVISTIGNIQIPEGSISNCTFENNNATNGLALFIGKGQATTIRIDGPTTFTNTGETGVLVVSNVGTLEINNATFDHRVSGSSTPNFRGIDLKADTSTYLFGCTFQGCSHQNGAHAILAYENSTNCEINSCTFFDCSGYPRTYVIESICDSFSFINSKIDFTSSANSTVSAGGICIKNRSTLYIDSSIFKNCHSGTSSSAGRRGAAIQYNADNRPSTKTEDISVSGTIFENCFSTSGRAIFLNKLNHMSQWYNCTFRNFNTTGDYVFIIGHSSHLSETHRLENLIFENIKSNIGDGGGGAGFWYSQVDSLVFQNCQFINCEMTKENVSGGALGYTPNGYTTNNNLLNVSLTFDNCIFRNNKVHSSANGSSLYIRSPRKPYYIQSCTFSNDDSTQKSKFGGAIYIDSDSKEVTIDQCNFTTSCTQNGNAIYSSSNSTVNIQNSIFTNCGNSNTVIYSVGQNLVISGSKITFTDTSKSCRGIKINSRSQISLSHCIIEKCFSSEQGCGFCYVEKGSPPPTAVFEERIYLFNVTIDNCGGANGRALYGNSLVAPTFSYVTISNFTQMGTNIFVWGHNSQVSEVVFTDCSFINLKSNTNDGGGCGMWLSDTNTLEFNRCTFKNISSGTNGGALAYSGTDRITNTNLLFYQCLFDNNVAADNFNGSALYINITRPLNISYCNFTNNGNNGGAVYITSLCPSANIDHTEFHLNTDSNGNGNAIQFMSGIKQATITDSLFLNNGQNGCVIKSNAENLLIKFSNILFSEKRNSRGVEIGEICTISIENSTFSNCQSDKGGGGLIYNPSADSENLTENIQIIGTTFDNNSVTGVSGSSFLLYMHKSAPKIQDCIIRNHLNGKFYMVIFYTNLINVTTKLENCQFENNYFAASGQSDGGIWIAPLNTIEGFDSFIKTIEFTGCTFTKNSASRNGGAFAIGDSSTTKRSKLIFDKCVFRENEAKNNQGGGALYIATNEECLISDCTFESNIASSSATSKGNAIVFKGEATATIIGTEFHNNGESGSAILSEAVYINIESSYFYYDSNEGVGARGLEIHKKARIFLKGVDFARCQSTGNGGALIIDQTSQSQNQCEISIEDCEFDNNTAINGSALFIQTEEQPLIRNCVIKNHIGDAYIFFVSFTGSYTTFEIEGCSFQQNQFQNTAQNYDGGGSGIWIANSNSNETILKLTFKAVEFLTNSANSYGGAYSIGSSTASKNIMPIFEGCTFNGNTAGGGRGGGLYITTSQGFTVSECTFKNNIASGNNGKGGSIMIDYDSDVQITNSSFEYESAQSDGNSISISSKSKNVFISGCTFVDCGSSGYVISAQNKNMEFLNSMVQFNEELASCGGISITNSGSFSISNNTFILCKSTNGGGIYYSSSQGDSNDENIQIYGNTFDLCIADNGCAIYARLSNVPIINDNNVENCRYGTKTVVIIISADIDEYLFDGFIFENSIVQNQENQEDGGGCGLSFEFPNSSDLTITYRNCTWRSNTAAYVGGALAYGRSQNSRNHNLIFDNCTFDSNNVNDQFGGALWLRTTNTILIRDCNFTNNKALGTESYGGAIYFDTQCTAAISIISSKFYRNSAIDANAIYFTDNLKSVSIDSCEIKNNGNQKSAILSSSKSLEIVNTYLGFEQYTNKGRGLHVIKASSLIISNSSIAHCDATNEEGGGILYEDNSASRAIKDNETNEYIEITNTNFTNCKSQKGCALMLYPKSNVIFDQNAIIDCRQGTLIFAIISQVFTQNYEINDCIFEHNLFNNNDAEDGGGSGLYFSHQSTVSPPEGEYPILTFTRCSWIENLARNVGGGFAYGASELLKNTELIFTNCVFNDNMAKGPEAGALWLSTNQKIEISNCTFTRNKAQGTGAYGGAIVIQSESDSISISYCNFDSCTAKDGCGLYIKQNTKHVSLLDCNFDNCGVYGSVINVESKAILVDRVKIEFTSISKSCKGMNFSARCNAIIRNSFFIQCSSQSDGGGICYNNLLNSDNEESLLIEGTLFNKCSANSGSAIHANLNTPIELHDNLFWYHTSGKFIICAFYHTFVNETIIQNCYFEHNSFSSETDGGGSGIWIANSNRIYQQGTANLIFSGCTWINNSASQYGGAFSIGKSNTLKSINGYFLDCNFVNNTANNEYGGALYIILNGILEIDNCFFDGNSAAKRGGALYFSKNGDVKIKDSQFARNKADIAGAIYCDGRAKVSFESLNINENSALSEAASLYIYHEGTETVEIFNSTFNFVRSFNYQIALYGSSESEIKFSTCCFKHTGDNSENTAIHIMSRIPNSNIIFDERNCFDASEFNSFYNSLQANITDEDIFNCDTCKVPVIPTLSPSIIPTRSPSPTPQATPRPTSSIPLPTLPPTQSSIHVPTLEPSLDIQSIIYSETDSTPTNNEDDNTDSSSSSNGKKIGMIVGIVISSVIIIVAIILLLWLFISRKGNSSYDNKPQSETQSSLSTANGSGVVAVTDDPIWHEQMTSQDNPLYQDTEDDNFMNAYEENW